MQSKSERRFLKAVRGSGLVPEADIERALELQARAADRGQVLAIDRVLLKLDLLDRDQIMGLWRALRYYLWRKEDKLYLKVAVQSNLIPQQAGDACLKEQKQAYKDDNQVVRANQIAVRRGYLSDTEDRALVKALRSKHPGMTVVPAADAPAPTERRSTGAARSGEGPGWRDEARRRDLADLRAHFDSSGELRGVSDEDLDALWEEADLSDVDLDSNARDVADGLLDESEDDLRF